MLKSVSDISTERKKWTLVEIDGGEGKLRLLRSIPSASVRGISWQTVAEFPVWRCPPLAFEKVDTSSLSPEMRGVLGLAIEEGNDASIS